MRPSTRSHSELNEVSMYLLYFFGDRVPSKPLWAWAGYSRLGLLPSFIRNLRRDLNPTQTADILGNAAIERLGNLLPILGGHQLMLVAGVGDEGDLRQDGRHVRADQNDERRLL